MSGERDPSVLLRAMQPVINPGEYVFVTIPGGDTWTTWTTGAAGATGAASIPPGLDPIVMVREPEGRTLVIERSEADRAGLAYSFVAGWITLHVHSALDAVGLTAAVATALAHHGMSCNVVAGYYHDHLFVAHGDTNRALGVLEALTRSPPAK